MPAIEVIHGDLFSAPTDLMIVPCSRVPTVTGFVAERLQHFDIPTPSRPLPAAGVEYVPLPETSNSIARIVGYAASVGRPGAGRSRTIELIARKIGNYCATRPEISSVSAPLLGSGAGGMYPVESATSIAHGFLATASGDVTLRLFVLDGDEYELIRKTILQTSAALMPAKAAVRVFVSYTPTAGKDHTDWVKHLATRLREDGLNTRLDIWHLAHGMDLPQWMCSELQQADRVVLLCDDHYAAKADGRHGGVGWEVRLMQGELLASQSENPDKFIPIITTEDREAGTPAFLASTYSFHWPSREESGEYDDLVAALYRAQETAPPIGAPPTFVLERLRESFSH